jgi:hypothetical protein
MDEEQWLQEFEHSDSEICTSGCLLAFFSKDANSNVSFQNHGYIIGTITNCEGNFFRESLSNQHNNVCFLLWRYSAS